MNLPKEKVMNKDLIKQQLQANRDNPLNVKEVIETVEVGTPIRIAKDGIEFYPHMVVIRHEESGKCAVVQYRGKLPKKFDLSGNNTSNVSKSILISKASADIIEDAIDTWFNYLHYHVNAYQFVLVYCLTRGLDLIETGIIDL
jgi:hypothetical protein